MDISIFKPYAVILVTMGPELTYGQKLMALEWRQRRLQIISRDKCTCRRCGREAIATEQGYETPVPEEKLAEFKERRRKEIEERPDLDLLGDGSFMIRNNPAEMHPFETIEIHVHHRYYIRGGLPWEYEDDVLVTVCGRCHKAIHLEQKILCFESSDLTDGVELIACDGCDGDGYFEEYRHVNSGVCFKCGGKGYLNIGEL